MPDALTTLMNMDSPSNAGGRVEVYQPRILRNNARTGALAKFLGIEDDGSVSQSDMESAYQAIQDEQDKAEEEKAQRATYPARIAADAALKGEELKGQYGLQIETAKAKAAEQAKQEALAAQQEMNNARIESANQRVAQQQAGTTQRTGMMQQGYGGRQIVGQREAQAKLLDTGKMEPTYPPTNGVLDNLQYYLGLGKYDRTTAAQNQAAELRKQNSQAVSTPSDEEMIATIRAKHPELSDEQIQQAFAEFKAGR